MNLKLPAVLMLSCALGACSTSPADWLLTQYGSQNTVAAFQVCKNYGCAVHMTIGLDGAEWEQVRALFTPAPQNAAEEREDIRHAIALLETLVGPKAGTEHDQAGAEIINFDRRGQLDCIDEAYNTTTYLKLLAADQLLQWHDVGKPALRGHIIDGWFHNTATVIEHGSSTAYTVDSWFHANGEMPETVLLSVWLAGWHPPQTVAAK